MPSKHFINKVSRLEKFHDEKMLFIPFGLASTKTANWNFQQAGPRVTFPVVLTWYIYKNIWCFRISTTAFHKLRGIQSGFGTLLGKSSAQRRMERMSTSGPSISYCKQFVKHTFFGNRSTDHKNGFKSKASALPKFKKYNF